MRFRLFKMWPPFPVSALAMSFRSANRLSEELFDDEMAPMAPVSPIALEFLSSPDTITSGVRPLFAAYFFFFSLASLSKATCPELFLIFRYRREFSSGSTQEEVAFLQRLSLEKKNSHLVSLSRTWVILQNSISMRFLLLREGAGSK